jgi:rhodanese-related sulfurtransferase
MSTPGIPHVDVHEAARRAESGEALMLDVRENDEWTAGRAPVARHLPLSELRLEQVPTDRPVLAMCRSGNRSGRVTEALVAAGVDAVNVAGGMQAWEQAGLPVVADDGRPGTVT